VVSWPGAIILEAGRFVLKHLRKFHDGVRLNVSPCATKSPTRNVAATVR